MQIKDRDATLFLVDDDDVDAMAIERALKKSHISNPIIRAKDGLQALEMLRSGVIEKPFVILLDLQMPRMNGFEFLGEIRNDDKLDSCVTFVMTTSRSKDDIEATYHKQVAGYFIKDNTGNDFKKIANMLEDYWKIVYLPE